MKYEGWQSYDALEETIRRDTVAVAQALHQSKSLVLKWKETPATDEDYTQSGARNPLDRLVTIMNTIEKIDPERAYVPIKWLCARFGFMPPIQMPKAQTGTNVQKDLLEWTREFGETCAEISASLADGVITKAEMKEIYREMREDLEKSQKLMASLREMMT